MPRVTILLAILGTSCLLTAADISGKWVGSLESAAASGHVYLMLHQQGESVSGTVAYGNEAREAPIEKGEVHGDQVTFEVHDNPNRVVKFRLTVTDAAMSGEATAGNSIAKVALNRPEP